MSSFYLCHLSHLILSQLGLTADCLVPNCSGKGACILGECKCYHGYKGSDCSLPIKINITHVCAKDCSGHGRYNVDEGKCKCERLFAGLDCEKGNHNNPAGHENGFLLNLPYPPVMALFIPMEWRKLFVLNLKKKS